MIFIPTNWSDNEVGCFNDEPWAPVAIAPPIVIPPVD